VGQPAERFTVPRDEEIERRLVDRRLGDARLCQQEAFGAFTAEPRWRTAPQSSAAPQRGTADA